MALPEMALPENVSYERARCWTIRRFQTSEIAWVSLSGFHCREIRRSHQKRICVQEEVSARAGTTHDGIGAGSESICQRSPHRKWGQRR
jgi:hypothetical protein